MSNPERYASLAELAARLTERVSAQDELTRRLAAASGAVESYTGRMFTLDTEATARVYEPTRSDRVHVDDFATTDDMVVKVGRPGSFAVFSDFWVKPHNAPAHGRPYEWVWSDSRFEVSTQSTVEVTAVWGWPAVPDEVAEATLIAASRLWSRRDSPTGVAGFGDYGVVRITASDVDVAQLLNPYARPSGGW